MQVLSDQNRREIVAISVKGLGLDSNGLQQYVWATRTQLGRLLEAQFDEKERNYVFQLGDRGIRPCDIVSFKIVDVNVARQWPSFRKYALTALERETEYKEYLAHNPVEGWIE